MADYTPATNTDAPPLRTRVSEDEFIRLSKAHVGTLVHSIKSDLETLAHNGRDNDDRLTRIETQTRALAEAVIAMAKTFDTLASRFER